MVVDVQSNNRYSIVETLELLRDRAFKPLNKVQEMVILSTPQLVIGHHRGRISGVGENRKHEAGSSGQVSKEVEEKKQWLNTQPVDTYGGRFSFRGTKLDLKWSPPHRGVIKCNVNADWKNPGMLNGVAWIARDSAGSVLYHARDVLTRSYNRIIAELRCILLVLQSLRNLRLHGHVIIISSDCQAAIAALRYPLYWPPRYRALLEAIRITARSFPIIRFEVVSCPSNSIARDIAESVLKGCRFNSYLALGGPAWLRNRLRDEAQCCV